MNITNFGGQLNLLSETKTGANVVGIYPNHPPQLNEAGCHSLVFFFGAFPPTIPDSNDNFNLSSSESVVTTLACRQLIQEVDTDIELLSVSMTMSPSRPPVPREETVRYVNSGAAMSSNVQEFQVMYPIDSQFFPVTDDPYQSALLRSFDGLDNFYKAILLTTDVREPSELVGEKNIARLANVTSKMYGRYMAQVMSRIVRTSGSEELRPAFLEHTEMRLVQNSKPKLALQILLAVMTVCGIAAWALLPASKLLPHDPCSIAGRQKSLGR